MRRSILAFTLVLSCPTLAVAQLSGFRDSVTVTPGKAYAKGGLYRLFFGNHYRDLWTTPIRVPVLDLATFARGLKPLKEGGGEQSISLRLQGADGRQYVFRSVDKDPSVVLPKALRETFADRILQDQISSGHPAGPLVAAPLLSAAGVLNAEPTLVVMPDDPALGQFRAKFKNVLGMIEVRPTDSDEEGASFAGAKEVVGYDDLVKRIDKNPNVRVDTRAFLLARLTDVFLGDWDRHRDQWRWALVEDSAGARWEPIPRDRDQAFARFDGLMPGIASEEVPKLLNFGSKYSPIHGATYNGRDLDRRFLTDLEWPAWDSVAHVLQARMTDSVITSAVGKLPPEFYRIDGARMTRALKARRDAIPKMARRYYDHLVGEVDVYGSDRTDHARVTRVDDRFVDVTLSDAAGSKPYFRRRFDARETDEVRVYLEGGRDTAVVDGNGGAGTTIRFIGGGGEDRFADSSSRGGAHFYDSRGTNSATGGSINTRPYRAIDDTTDPIPHRDWGRRSRPLAVIGFGSDLGALFSLGARTTWYGFRKKPYSSSISYKGTIATGAVSGRLDLNERTYWENSHRFVGFDAKVSGIEALRWFGFGNDSPIDLTKPTAFFRLNQQVLSLDPFIGWSLARGTTLTLGPSIKYSSTGLGGKNGTRFIGDDRPFGVGQFLQSAIRMDLISDMRNSSIAATKGGYLSFGGSYSPKLFDVDRAFGEVHTRIAAYMTAKMPMQPTLALQVGGKKIWGTAGHLPFFEAAQLGSNRGLRGYQADRFAGDNGSVYAMAELRLHLTNIFIFVPGQQGVFGFYDGGRVYQKGEVSDTWHSGVGGGVWFGFVGPTNALSASIGHSTEGNRLYVSLGFGF